MMISCPLEVLNQAHDWCRALYYLTFGPIEGERRFCRLPLVDAFDLWLLAEGMPLPSPDRWDQVIAKIRH